MNTETPKQSADTMPTELALFDGRGMFIRPTDDAAVTRGWSDEKIARYGKVHEAAIIAEDAEAELKSAVDAFNAATIARQKAETALSKVRPRLTQKDLVRQMAATDAANPRY